MTNADLRFVSASDARCKDYQRLAADAGWLRLDDRTQIELTGADRQSFLHNLCTNDIKGLGPGQGCEAFVTSVQGRCLGHVFAFAGAESLIVETTPGQADRLLTHWDRYLITEDVQLHDRSEPWTELLLIGPRSPELLADEIGTAVADRPYGHQAATLGEVDIWIRRVPLSVVPSFLIACRREDQAAVEASVTQRLGQACDAAAWHMLRIEAGFPWYGWDISEQNLPQEVNRNAQAINFRKGCYLGQETVARIDALGHVNQVLTGVKCPADVLPEVDEPLKLPGSEGKSVGRITSAVYSPALQATLALAYVRDAHRRPGTELSWSHGTASVVDLPCPPVEPARGS